MSTLTVVHVAISLAGILSGFVVIFGMLAAKRCQGWTAFFLATTIATSVTGFFFPITKFTPALAFGILSLLILALAVYALYGRRLAGHWRWIYVVGAVLAQYLNVFVLVVQSFLKIPALNALAPTQAEPPFAIAQGGILVLFIVLGIATVKKFRVDPADAAHGGARSAGSRQAVAE